MFAIPAQKILTPKSMEILREQVVTLLEQEEAEEKEREYIQARVDAKFTCLEQSLIWQCMNDKNTQQHHEMLNPVIRKHMSTSVPDLWRGLTHIELRNIMDIEPGDTFTLGRITSFSADEAKAREFAGYYTYNTKTMLELRNPGWAYNYYADMMDMLLGAPDSEFGHEEREEKIDMVESEQEFMLPIEARFKLLDIVNTIEYPDYNIYQIELLEW